jgi:hypothetical protein
MTDHLQLNAAEQTVWVAAMTAYRKRFDEGAPLWFWYGTRAALIPIINSAVATGEPLTADKLHKLQGLASTDHEKVY